MEVFIQTSSQIPIENCSDCIGLGLGVCVCVGVGQCEHTIRACLYRTAELTLRQLCDDTSDIAVVENNGVTPEWDYNPFLNDSIVFIDSSITSIIPELLQR